MDEKDIRTKVEQGVKESADKYGWDIQPDPKKLEKIYAGLVRNTLKHGKGYCPCAVILPVSMTAGAPRDISGHICPCTSAKTDIETKGKCKCGLFFAKTVPEKKESV
jgi:ferredoxin-thioredoxin reductase catalytic subunit